jgi:A/G-specific adenine glycosylase
MQERLRRFRRLLYGYFARHGRDLPWRSTADPYCILVSEIMLQQTQVDRVVKKYPEFIRAFPNFAALHRASLADVYKVWRGLGYNRRALALKKTAAAIVQTHNGAVPQSTGELIKLPGIGKATACSICVFAFNHPEIFIETNVRTVFIHHFFRDKESVEDAELLALIREAMDKKDPRTWYSALMDYGTMLKAKFPNPSRRSAHHKSQAPFKGSRRQVRGAVLRLLSSTGRLSEKQIEESLEEGHGHSLKDILEELCHEGLLACKRGRYSLG